MKERWVNSNVDLSALRNKIVEFFSEREFSISVRDEGRMFTVSAYPQAAHKIAEKIVVKISGDQCDFSIEFIAGKHSNELIKLGSLLTLIGGGFLAKKGLNSLDRLEALERDFWVFVHKVIGELSNEGLSSLS